LEVKSGMDNRIGPRFLEREDWTPELLAALATIRSVDTDTAARVYSEAVADRHLADFMKSTPPCESLADQWWCRQGLKLAGGRWCIQRLKPRRRCMRFNPRCYRDGGRCECQPPGSDHDRLFLKDGKPFIYVTQPYGMTYKTVVEMVQFAERNGLVTAMKRGK
jgi:hypothetical protein